MITLNLAGLFTGCFTSKNDETETEPQEILRKKQELFSRITHHLKDYSGNTGNKEKIRFILNQIMNCYECDIVCLNILNDRGDLVVHSSYGIQSIKEKNINVKVYPIFNSTNKLIGTVLFGKQVDINPDKNLINIFTILGQLLD